MKLGYLRSGQILDSSLEGIVMDITVKETLQNSGINDVRIVAINRHSCKQLKRKVFIQE